MTAVFALAILMFPVAQPYGDIIRSKSTRCPPESTIAILTGLRSSLARCLLASNILRAISIDRFTQLLLFAKTQITQASPNNYLIRHFCKYSVLSVYSQVVSSLAFAKVTRQPW